MPRRILHIDVNNAFLSWSAVYMLKHGSKVDIRTIPSIIGGDENKRSGIVLAKSPIAKKFGIVTGEPIYFAKKKCNNLQIFKGDFNIYREYSKAFYSILIQYSDKVERFSIDECFVDMTDVMKDKDIVKIAYEIKDRIYKELGFTVNVGVASNKLLAKMASDFEKPNKVHTLFDSEIQSKMWPLNIADLYGIGKMTIPKLLKMNIKTIGDLAQSDKKYILRKFGKYGNMIWNHANGIDNSPVEERNQSPKSIGNQETLPKDLYTKEEIEKILSQIAEEVTYRLRKYNLLGTVISVSLRTNKFEDYSHQKKLLNPTSNTKEVIMAAKEVLKEMELKGPIRQVGLKLDKLSSSEEYQISLFDNDLNNSTHNKLDKLDKTLDELKAKYGYTKITRGSSLK